ncbi:hypothetical protein BIV24_19595 [Streptomyces colonosanans]|uniref:Uncharacterized protein n=1 Tax=Streptomyces colonosanans TaxID=1428652 RepID=A0A1S2P6S1_9ACTN|nr:hypothetical protein BIV24_19595 [Streptomyces colonosanans]
MEAPVRPPGRRSLHPTATSCAPLDVATRVPLHQVLGVLVVQDELPPREEDAALLDDDVRIVRRLRP